MECIGEIDLSVGGVWRLGSGVAGGGVLRRVFLVGFRRFTGM